MNAGYIVADDMLLERREKNLLNFQLFKHYLIEINNRKKCLLDNKSINVLRWLGRLLHARRN